MSTDPDGPEPDLTADELYLFADDEPPPAPRPPVPVSEPGPTKRRRRREDDEETLPEETESEEEEPRQPEEIGDRILKREEEDPGRWWAVPVGLIVTGLVLCLVPIGVLASEIGVGKAALTFVLVLLAVVVQLVSVTGFLVVVGTFFGIDYGPAKEAVLKLAAVVAIVDGLTGVMLLCNPCGLVLAAIVGASTFQYLFRLSVFETLVSVGGMVAAAWILNAAVVSVLVSKKMPKMNQRHEPVRYAAVAEIPNTHPRTPFWDRLATSAPRRG